MIVEQEEEEANKNLFNDRNLIKKRSIGTDLFLSFISTRTGEYEKTDSHTKNGIDHFWRLFEAAYFTHSCIFYSSHTHTYARALNESC